MDEIFKWCWMINEWEAEKVKKIQLGSMSSPELAYDSLPGPTYENSSY